ncbi:unnamed protein product (macronuclear) [Paramecium tetraurelia]|uniref:Uncharacterized protein n=1 Tax=Paramecium tetraurelia TaxID=5888 RepID=A0BTM0_PARTE|nr:uncharacterized protein GSPATT00032119001 [Paramecium tetraurelia]CAK61887.1 unnamed protein product [Paramecium tetraurelia]|eukprot:XP_001429285.1 hypothetical protein (macronuclear) [Paramecium tetraurelia strain d4-2]
MTTEYSFESNVDINSDEEIKQVKICPFQTHFQFCYDDNTYIQNEQANQPIPSPAYKFMGVSYSNDESVQYQSILRGVDNIRRQDRVIQTGTINVSKSVSILRENKRNKRNNKPYVASMQQIKMNSPYKNILGQIQDGPNKKPRNSKNTPTKIKNVSPQGILKICSFEGPPNQNPNSVSYQLISNKKVQFEFTQEQIKSMKKINIANVLINQRTRFVFI